MSNKEIVKNLSEYYQGQYLLYLRSETIKKVYNPLYIPDKSYEGYKNSKFSESSFSYSHYLAESLSKSINYSEYISESLDRSISYSEYLAEHIDSLDKSISYTQYCVQV